MPKRRKSILFGRIREELKKISHELAEQKDCRIIEGTLSVDHARMRIEIPPKYAVASVIGFFKGKSAIAIARTIQNKERNYTGMHFWARGYAVSTVGFDEEIIRNYIKGQNDNDR